MYGPAFVGGERVQPPLVSPMRLEEAPEWQPKREREREIDRQSRESAERELWICSRRSALAETVASHADTCAPCFYVPA